ncbi:MAG TPA: response regulator transcription factor [Stellaceae bacterium]|nr:response regulator transcription factor [Stellaceae bacterium]
MTACRLVIADDHPLFRDALRLTIGQSFGEADIVEADSFDSLRARLEAVPDTDLVLLDLNMPGIRAFSGLLYIRASFSAVPVAIISANEEPRVMRLALELGASGYIPKSATPGEIRAALAALLAGKTWLPPTLDPRRSPEDPEAAMVAGLASLTPQQVRVMMLLSDGLLNKQIAHLLDVTEATVKAHVSAILQKLGVDNRTQAVIVARRLAGDTAAAQEDFASSARADGRPRA